MRTLRLHTVLHTLYALGGGGSILLESCGIWVNRGESGGCTCCICTVPPALLRAYPIAQRLHHLLRSLHSVCTARWGERHIPVSIHALRSIRRTCAPSMACYNAGCASTTHLLALQVWRIPSAFPTRVTAVLRSVSSACISRLRASQATHNRCAPASRAFLYIRR
mgnify:CR=1 FL=1